MSSCPNLDQLTDADYISALGRKADMANVPLTASIELTERCNLHCTHCYLGDQERLRHNRERELVTAQWMRILDEMADMGCLYLLITGGDPMLRKDFADIYRHARSRGFLVTLFTNGTLLTPTIIDLFREWPPYTLEITLYGVTRETYEKITGIPGSYMRCMAGIEQLEQLGIGLGLKTVLMRSNRHEFDEIATFCRTHSTDKFRFDAEIQGQFDGSGGPLKERLDPEEVVRMEFSDSERAADWQEYWQRRKGQKMAPSKRLYNCGAGVRGLHVNPYGQLQPCLVARHIGVDLTHSPLVKGLEMIRSELAQRLVPAGHTCNQCDYRVICNSCPAFSMLECGSEEKPAEYQCRTTQLRVNCIESGEIDEL